MAKDERFVAVGAYIARLESDLYGSRSVRRRIAAEIRSHLEESIVQGVERGLSLESSQREALERFGSPQVVINSWAESKGIGMVTSFTRYGGLAGIIGALGLIASMVYAEISWSFSIGWFAEIALGSGAFLTFGMLALYLRLRGKLGRYARFGFRLIIIGLVTGFGSSMLWFTPGGVVAIALLIAGMGLYLVGALQTGVVPRAPLMLWVAGFILCTSVGLFGVVSGIDTGLFAAAIGYSGFGIGWLLLGTHLWSEHPTFEEQGSALPA